MKMDTSATNLRLRCLLAIAGALLCGCGPSRQQIQADIRLMRQDVTTLSNAAAARDPVAVFNAIEDRVSLGANWRRAEGQDEQFLGWASSPADKAYLDAQRVAAKIIDSMSREEWDRTGLNSEDIETQLQALKQQAVSEGTYLSPANPPWNLTAPERLVLYQRIESDCARALSILPQ